MNSGLGQQPNPGSGDRNGTTGGGVGETNGTGKSGQAW